MDTTQAAEAIGKAEAEISSTLRILSLPPEILDELLMSKVPVSAIRTCGTGACARRNTLEEAKSARPRRRPNRCDDSGGATRHAIRGVFERSGENGVRRSVWPAVTSIGLLRVAERLRGLRELVSSVGAKEREALLHLREEIDSVLKLSDELLEA